MKKQKKAKRLLLTVEKVRPLRPTTDDDLLRVGGGYGYGGGYGGGGGVHDNLDGCSYTHQSTSGRI